MLVVIEIIALLIFRPRTEWRGDIIVNDGRGVRAKGPTLENSALRATDGGIYADTIFV